MTVPATAAVTILLRRVMGHEASALGRPRAGRSRLPGVDAKSWLAGAAEDENGVVGCVRLKHVLFMSDRLRGDAGDGEDLAHRARATASGNGARREQRP